MWVTPSQGSHVVAKEISIRGNRLFLSLLRSHINTSSLLPPFLFSLAGIFPLLWKPTTRHQLCFSIAIIRSADVARSLRQDENCNISGWCLSNRSRWSSSEISGHLAGSLIAGVLLEVACRSRSGDPRCMISGVVYNLPSPCCRRCRS